MRNYYEILGVDRVASKDEIKTAYRKISLKIHPDVNEGDTFFTELFKNINEAHEVLSDDDKRRNYDAQLDGKNEGQENFRQEEARRKQEEELKKEGELKRNEQQARAAEEKLREARKRQEEHDRAIQDQKEKSQYVRTILEETPVPKKVPQKTFSVPWLTIFFLGLLGYGVYRLYNKPALTSAGIIPAEKIDQAMDNLYRSHPTKINKPKHTVKKVDSFAQDEKKLDEKMERQLRQNKTVETADSTSL